MIKQKIKLFLENFFDVSIIKNEQIIVGMISPEERELFKSYSEKMADKPGAIVDLGTWMGASAAAFAEGLRIENDEFNTENGRIYTFDRFIWEESMNVSFIDSDRICKYEPGESFLPEVRKNLSRYTKVIELSRADLRNYKWERNGIKILHVDAMKGWDLCTGIARGFYSHLQKESLLIHQDYKHWYTPMIHILQYRLREYFSFYHEVDTGGTVVFLTKSELPDDVILKASDFSSIEDEEVEKAFEYSFSLINEKYWPKIAAAHVMCFVHRDEISKARKLFEKYDKRGYAASGDMKNTKIYISQIS